MKHKKGAPFLEVAVAVIECCVQIEPSTARGPRSSEIVKHSNL
jgi:hypothetical protein